jgi:dimethylglycine dehydrogenase
VHPDKGEFIGRDALLTWGKRGFANAFVTMEVQGPPDADALGNNPIYLGGELVGRATGGNYGFRVDKSLALAMVQPAHAAEGRSMEIEILGERYAATVIAESPWDPRNERLRS